MDQPFAVPDIQNSSIMPPEDSAQCVIFPKTVHYFSQFSKRKNVNGPKVGYDTLCSGEKPF
jgi:hypothetical protein